MKVDFADESSQTSTAIRACHIERFAPAVALSRCCYWFTGRRDVRSRLGPNDWDLYRDMAAARAIRDEGLAPTPSIAVSIFGTIHLFRPRALAN